MQSHTARALCTLQVLRVANTLSGIFNTVTLNSGGNSAPRLREPELPRLVVVGTQSSGKSSLLNGFLAADILPLGEQERLQPTRRRPPCDPNACLPLDCAAPMFCSALTLDTLVCADGDSSSTQLATRPHT